MNRQVTILAIILFTILGFMGYNSYKTQEMVGRTEVC